MNVLARVQECVFARVNLTAKNVAFEKKIMKKKITIVGLRAAAFCVLRNPTGPDILLSYAFLPFLLFCFWVMK